MREPTFELYHLYSAHPGWDLEADGISMTGTATRPALPGPSVLTVAYIDEPRCARVTGELALRALGAGRVRLTGTLDTDRGPIEVALDAALVT